METLELGWGNPCFLIPYWNRFDLSYPTPKSTAYIFGHIPELEANIRKLHIQEKNANVDDKYLVVGNGATQLLVGILKTLGKPVTAEPPYFKRFLNFADMAGVPWKNELNGIKIITTPNNPDGKVPLTVSANSPLIYDLSYNWSQYTDPVQYDEDIMVFSLAKATGHASTRIGWAIFKDKELALKVKDYVEFSTCGVSIEAQLKANQIIKNQLNRTYTCFEYGSVVLDARHELLNNMKLPFKKLSNNGMFLWLKMKNHKSFFNKRNIVFTDGKDMGSPGYARINIGCSEVEFKEFIKRIGTT